MPKPTAAGDFIAELLREQASLSAVEQFSEWHSLLGAPAAQRNYSRLLPATAPGPGQQYGFDVNLDRCTGCKACVAACHSLNGLDDEEAWRDVGLLVGSSRTSPFQQTVTTACHHCVEPACLEGCPVLAYDKDPLTGIVRHLDDQCIGCSYCIMKCPYEVPKFSKKLGIVRKCDLCSNRLAVGEAPACAQACPNEAIKITLVDQATLRREFEVTPAINTFLPASPDPSYTIPTTRYHSTKPRLTTVKSADEEALRPSDPHWPLVIMLTLSQVSVGLFTLALLVKANLSLIYPGAVIGGVAIASSVLHLGRPAGAWRAFLGLRTSWLSREIILLGNFLGAALAAATLAYFAIGALWVKVAVIAAVANGLAGVFCSAMIYADTRKPLWKAAWTLKRFFGTTFLSGGSGALLLTHLMNHPGEPVAFIIVLVGASLKLSAEKDILGHLYDDDFSPLHKSALLLFSRFGLPARLGKLALITGGVLLPLIAFATRTHSPIPYLLGSALVLVSEFIERSLFFRAVQGIKMPGQPTS